MKNGKLNYELPRFLRNAEMFWWSTHVSITLQHFHSQIKIHWNPPNSPYLGGCRSKNAALSLKGTFPDSWYRRCHRCMPLCSAISIFINVDRWSMNKLGVTRTQCPSISTFTWLLNGNCPRCWLWQLVWGAIITREKTKIKFSWQNSGVRSLCK